MWFLLLLRYFLGDTSLKKQHNTADDEDVDNFYGFVFYAAILLLFFQSVFVRLFQLDLLAGTLKHRCQNPTLLIL